MLGWVSFASAEASLGAVTVQVLLQTAIEEQLWERVQQHDLRSTSAGWHANVMLSSMCVRRLTWSWLGSSKIGRGPACSVSIAVALAVAAQAPAS